MLQKVLKKSKLFTIHGKVGRLDPSRTITLRRQFQRDLSARFAKLRQAIVKMILHDDTLELKPCSTLVFHAIDEDNGRWVTIRGAHVFVSDVGKITKGPKSLLDKTLDEAAKIRVWPKEAKKSQKIHAEYDRKQPQKDFAEYKLAHPRYHFNTGRQSIDYSLSDAAEKIAGSPGWKETHYAGTSAYFEHESGTVIRVSDHPIAYVKQTADAYIYPGASDLFKDRGFDGHPGSAEAAIKAAIEHQKSSIKRLKLNAEGRWQFHSTEQKLNAFREWLKRQIILHIVSEHMDEEAWWNRYIEDGFRRGAARAFDDARPQVREWTDSPEAKARLDFYNGTREEFLRSSFNYPASRDKVKLLASRTFTDLKGVTDSMAARISHSLVDGLTKGDNPRVIARELAKQVDVGKVRAQTISRTEIIRTHAEGQLQAFQRMGVTHVGVAAEWLTAKDEQVCKLCRPLNGVVLKVGEAAGLLPRHPNCRCCFTPANVGEDKEGQKRTKKSIMGAFDDSYSAELPKTSKRTLAQQKAMSSWGGADKTISKNRPVSVFK